MGDYHERDESQPCDPDRHLWATNGTCLTSGCGAMRHEVLAQAQRVLAQAQAQEADPYRTEALGGECPLGYCEGVCRHTQEEVDAWSGSYILPPVESS